MIRKLKAAATANAAERKKEEIVPLMPEEGIWGELCSVFDASLVALESIMAADQIRESGILWPIAAIISRGDMDTRHAEPAEVAYVFWSVRRHGPAARARNYWRHLRGKTETQYGAAWVYLIILAFALRLGDQR